MRASTTMLLAIALAVIGRWAHNQKVTGQAVFEAVFVVIVIAALDHGKTEPIAKGFAWLFLAAVLLGDNSPLTGLAKVSQSNAAATKSVTQLGTGVIV